MFCFVKMKKKTANGRPLIGLTVMGIVPAAPKTCLKVIWRDLYLHIRQRQAPQTNCVFERFRKVAKTEY